MASAPRVQGRRQEWPQAAVLRKANTVKFDVPATPSQHAMTWTERLEADDRKSPKMTRELVRQASSKFAGSAAQLVRETSFKDPRASVADETSSRSFSRRRSEIITAKARAIGLVRESSECVLDPRRSRVILPTWDIITSLGLLYTMLIVPVEVAFGESHNGVDFIFVINRVFDFVFIIDLMLQFFIMYPDTSNAEL